MKSRYSKKFPAAARVQETALAPREVTRSHEGFESIQEIREGLPVERFFELEETLGVGTARLASVVGIPVRTLQRRKEDGRLTKEESDRLDRVFQLVGQAAGVFESSAAAREWLTHPQMGLAGFVPLDLADTGAGIREVESLLGRIDYGVYA
jgi:putative toxin-antitoxin system antitoxin component (TIGR02293 family)